LEGFLQTRSAPFELSGCSSGKKNKTKVAAFSHFAFRLAVSEYLFYTIGLVFDLSSCTNPTLDERTHSA